MAFDINMIRKVYKKYPSAVEAARKATNKPLTLSEKNTLHSPLER